MKATDEDYATLVERLMVERPEGPLHVFAYGSLIWKPTFEPAAKRRAVARGWHRRFCIQNRGHRALPPPEAPGLMMALMSGWTLRGAGAGGRGRNRAAGPGGAGLARVPFRRDDGLPALAHPRHGGGATPGAAVLGRATGPGIRWSLSLPEAAAQMARACGPAGSTAACLRNTVLSLEEQGIRDRNLWALQKLVAEEIDLL